MVLYGPVGTGKTHLAIALGVKACELGIATRFFTVASLVTRPSESKRAGHLERTVADLGRAELVIIDEWGYLPMDREEAQLLFKGCVSTQAFGQELRPQVLQPRSLGPPHPSGGHSQVSERTSSLP